MNAINHLLLIDDSEATNNFHSRLLGKLHFASTISICKNGQEALDFLTKCTTYPELIFLDLNMPILDGFEFLEHLKGTLSFVKTQQPLIVILTSSEETVDKERCMELYASIAFFSKPLTLAQIAKIKAILELNKGN